MGDTLDGRLRQVGAGEPFDIDIRIVVMRFAARCAAFAGAFVVLTFLVMGCGRKASPKPPELFAPIEVGFLNGRGELQGVVLTWLEPERKANGEPVDDLTEFVIRRSVYEKGERPDFDRIGTVEVERPESSKAGGATPGATPTPKLSGLGVKTARRSGPLRSFEYKDLEVKPGVTYDYTVTAINDYGTEGLAPRVVRVKFAGESSAVEVLTSAEAYRAEDEDRTER